MKNDSYRSLSDELEGALVNSEGKDFQISAEFVREVIAALRSSGPSHDWQNCVRCGAAILNNHPDATQSEGGK